MARQLKSKPIESLINTSNNKGKVNFICENYEFGSIKVLETGHDIFAHMSQIIDVIQANDIVLLDIEQGQKGPIAVNVRLYK